MSQTLYNSLNVYAIPTKLMAEYCRKQKERQEKVKALKLLRKYEKQTMLEKEILRK